MDDGGCFRLRVELDDGWDWMLVGWGGGGGGGETEVVWCDCCLLQRLSDVIFICFKCSKRD